MGFTYGNIVAMFARARRPVQALQWKEKMQSAGHTLSRNLYGRVIHCCAVKGRLEDGLALLEEMGDKAIAPPKEQQLQALRDLCRYRGLAPAILPVDDRAWERETTEKALNKKRPKKRVRYIGTKMFRQ